METFEHEGLVVQGVDRFLTDKPRAMTRGMLDRNDLLQEARLAVVRANRKHKARRSAFSTYATRAIHFALVRATLKAAGLPTNQRKNARKPRLSREVPRVVNAGYFSRDDNVVKRF